MRTRRRRFSRRRRLRGGAQANIPEELIDRTTSVQLPIMFGTSRVMNGQLLSQVTTKDAPAVEWDAPTGDFRTLLCFDPDAPARAWCHWLVVNCDGGAPLSGETLMDWAPPAPPSGIHRYYVCLFSHTSRVTTEDAPTQRGYFKVRPFLEKYGMRPVAYTMFRVKSR